MLTPLNIRIVLNGDPIPYLRSINMRCGLDSICTFLEATNVKGETFHFLVKGISCDKGLVNIEVIEADLTAVTREEDSENKIFVLSDFKKDPPK